MQKRSLNQNEQFNQCHPEHPTHVILNLIQDLNRDAECPQHDGLGSESGRSMVEMLGVLAVMGLLTIIGIAGFRVAMDKHYANQTVKRLMLRAMTVSSQRLLGQTVSLNDFDENDGEYSISNQVDVSESDVFLLKMNNVPKAVCEQLVNMNWNLAKMNPLDCSETTITFLFMNDLSDCSNCVNAGVPCDLYGNECGTCSKTRGFTPNDSDCEGKEGASCVNGHCAACEEGKYWYRGSSACRDCQNVNDYYGSIDSTKHNCLGKMFYGAQRMNGCSWRDSFASSDTDELSCKACSERCFHNEQSACYLMETSRLRRNKDGSCGTCVPGYYWSPGYARCLACNNENDWHGASELNKHNCPKTMFYAGTAMYGCIYSGSVSNADEESCKECDERCYDNGTCRMMGTTYGKDANGNCTN